MNKLYSVLLVALVGSSSLGAYKLPDLLSACPFDKLTEQEKLELRQAKDDFVKGLMVGGAQALAFDFLRAYILPDATRLNLYGKFGICREQLSGEVKMVSALVTLALQDKVQPQKSCNVIARVLGVVVGVNVAAYLRKLMVSAIKSRTV